jgi:hypothetical protein
MREHRKKMGELMDALQVLILLLALSGALNVAFGAGITARIAGAGLAQVILTAASAAGVVMGIFFAAVSAYR